MTKLDTDTNTEATASLDRADKFYVWNQHHGKSMRDIAKTLGCQPSTVMRHIHKIAKSKDNPKVARAISAVSTQLSDQDVTVDQQVAQAIKFLRQKKHGFGGCNGNGTRCRLWSRRSGGNAQADDHCLGRGSCAGDPR